LLIVQPSIGQTIVRSIEDVWKYADEHNVSIATSKMDLQKAVISHNQAYSPIMPQVSANGTFTDNTALQTTYLPAEIFGGPAGTYRAVKFGQKYIYSGNITASLDILNVQSWFNIQVAKYSKEVSSASFANTRKNVYQQLAVNYYSYLLMQEAARIAKESADITDTVFQSISNKYQVGLANEVSYNSSKINHERSELNYTTAQYQAIIALNTLKQLLNMSLQDSLQITEKLSREPEVFSNAVFQEDPNLRLMWKQSQISLAQYRASKFTLAPTLNLSYYNATQQNNNDFKPFESGTWFPQTYWTLRLTVPLFTGMSRYWQIKKDAIALQETRMLYESSKKQSAIYDENLRLSYQKAASVFYKSSDVMELYKKNYVHATHRYEEGVISIDDRMTVFSDYITYQKEYLNNLSDLLAQLYQIKVRQQSF